MSGSLVRVMVDLAQIASHSINVKEESVRGIELDGTIGMVQIF